jgi:hypothetical protein
MVFDLPGDGAVRTTLRYPRRFGDPHSPGAGRLYRRLVEAATDRGTWGGPPEWPANDATDRPDRPRPMSDHSTTGRDAANRYR